MAKQKPLLHRLLLGAVLATLPFVICFGVAELMIVFGVEPDGVPEQLAAVRREYAGLVIVFGAVLSLVSWCGLLLYGWSMLWKLTIGGRHERKLNAMRERGEIDF